MNNLKNTVELAKEKLKLSERKLSEAIGQNSSYISKMLKNGTSTKNQEVIIEKLNNLMAGNPVTDVDIIKDLSERLSNQVDNCEYWIKENVKLEQEKEWLKMNIGVNEERIDHLKGQLSQLQRHNTIAHTGYLLVIAALVLFIFLR